jgi:NAD(P)-dependent dehydrogenase (short-subunit alcohol dehydrogenase family)
MKEFRGRVAFVTGGARGIGYAIAQALLEQGMKVMIADVNEAALEAAKQSLAELGDVEAVVCDVADASAVVRASEEVIRRFGRVHVLVNNAGVVIGGVPGSFDLDDWRWIVDVNLMGVVYGVEAFVPLIKAHGEGGFIVNTASMAGHGGLPALGPYSATKFAVVGYSESLRQDLAEHDIGVAALCPGWVDTRIYESGFERPSRAGVALTEEDETTLEGARNFFATGLPPRQVAEWVIESIKRDASYIFTNADLRGAIDQRADVLREAYDASLASGIFSRDEPSRSARGLHRGPHVELRAQPHVHGGPTAEERTPWPGSAGGNGKCLHCLVIETRCTCSTDIRPASRPTSPRSD